MKRRAVPKDETGASASIMLAPGEVLHDKTRGFVAGDGEAIGGDVLLREKLAPVSILKKLPRIRWDELLNRTISPSVDLTGYLQEALDEFAGQTIAIPPMSLFIRKTMMVRAGTKLLIDPGCVLRTNTAAWIDSGIEETLNGETRPDVGFLIANANWDADEILDSSIQIVGGKYIRDDAGAGNQGHAILMRGVRGVLVDNVSVENGWNATAFLACRDTIVTNSYAHNVRNCGFDAWEGAGNVKVDKVTVRNDPGKEIAQGIQVSGMATDGGEGDSFAFQVTNATLIGIRSPEGYASAIIANAIGLGSSVRGGVISGNVVDDADNGLVVQGDVSAITGDGNVLRGVSKAPVLVIPDLSGLPSNISIDAMLVNCSSDNALGAIHGNRNDVRIRLVGSNPATRTVRFEGTATNCRAIIRGPVNENVPVQDDNPAGKNSATWDDVDESIVFTRGSGDPDAFTHGWTFRQLLQEGATGHFEGLHIVCDARAHGKVGQFIVGIQGMGRTDASGNVFGAGGYAQVGVTGLASAEVVGGEFNVDVRAPIVLRKVGVQSVDVRTSVGSGSAIDAAFWSARQVGGAGFLNGLQFGIGPDNEFALKNGTHNALISVKGGSGVSIGYALDANDITFVQSAIGLRAQALGHGIGWGLGSNDNRDGGEIRSDASEPAGKVIFTNGGLVVQNGNGANAFGVTDEDANPVAIVVNGSLKTVRAANSPPPGAFILYVD
ncbi:hypothetical protein [Sphingobium limneticum]|uniref:Uncharacterized protein n=1 Tax=Sphingobium limneticum TaxID=1007511 RepID=A0A5J5I8B5_9SPHN|nr:hypothetical protein [Sphingobium limneticum]KAA9020739.1 hypothetical protein F4U96_03485 [Sphingobium limneticum]KAA9033065.1 hypothetical protein F4U95_03485 [Sphingobium limneticum]